MRWMRVSRLLAVCAALVGTVLAPAAAGAFVVDQQQPDFDPGGNPLAIGGPSDQLLAQVVTTGIAGPLAALNLPVSCGPASNLVVDIEGVSGGLPDGSVLTSQTVAAADLPPFEPGSEAFRTIVFTVPESFAAGEEFAIVLSSAGSCSIVPPTSGAAYSGGSAYFHDTQPGPYWHSLAPPLGPADDLPFQTLVRVTRTVGIDIRPRNPRNVIRPGSHGPVTVAVLSAVDFDASDVDPSTVAFGPAGAAPDGPPSFSDVNGDGLDDALFDFRIDATGIACGDTSATLTATTSGGEDVTGSDAVTTVGCH
jgi:hypothetical protein